MKTLPELIVDDFDAEQVWAGVDLQNKAKFQKFVNITENLSQLTDNAKALQQLSSHNNNVTSNTIKRPCFNLISGVSVVQDNRESEEIYDEDDLHEIDLKRISKEDDISDYQQGRIKIYLKHSFIAFNLRCPEFFNR